MALDIPKMWARRMEAEMKDWEEPVAPTEQHHGRMVFPDTLPCEVEPRPSSGVIAPRGFFESRPAVTRWARWRGLVACYFRNLWLALRGEGL